MPGGPGLIDALLQGGHEVDNGFGPGRFGRLVSATRASPSCSRAWAYRSSSTPLSGLRSVESHLEPDDFSADQSADPPSLGHFVDKEQATVASLFVSGLKSAGYVC